MVNIDRLQQLAKEGDADARQALISIETRRGTRRYSPQTLGLLFANAGRLRAEGLAHWSDFSYSCEVSPDQARVIALRLKGTHGRTLQGRQWGQGDTCLMRLIKEALADGYATDYRDVSKREVDRAFRKGYGPSMRDKRCVAIVAVKQRDYVYFGAIKVLASAVSDERLIPNFTEFDRPRDRKQRRKALSDWCKRGFKPSDDYELLRGVEESGYRGASPYMLPASAEMSPDFGWIMRLKIVKGVSR